MQNLLPFRVQRQAASSRSAPIAAAWVWLPGRRGSRGGAEGALDCLFCRGLAQEPPSRQNGVDPSEPEAQPAQAVLGEQLVAHAHERTR